MRFFVFIVCVFLLFLSGCTDKPNIGKHENPKVLYSEAERKDWKVSPTFQSESATMVGIPNKMAVISGFNITDKYMWHFWGDEKTLNQGPLKVIATHQKTGLSEDALFVQRIGYTPNNGADASLPSNMTFSKPGLWRLDAYIGDTLFGSIVIDVKDRSKE
jgi:hypothetical protein